MEFVAPFPVPTLPTDDPTLDGRFAGFVPGLHVRGDLDPSRSANLALPRIVALGHRPTRFTRGELGELADDPAGKDPVVPDVVRPGLPGREAPKEIPECVQAMGSRASEFVEHLRLHGLALFVLAIPQGRQKRSPPGTKIVQGFARDVVSAVHPLSVADSATGPDDVDVRLPLGFILAARVRDDYAAELHGRIVPELPLSRPRFDHLPEDPASKPVVVFLVSQERPESLGR